MIFKSRQVNTDPKPWVYALLGGASGNYTPAREAEQVTGGFVFDPRPEYNVTRDPEPYIRTYNGTHRKRITTDKAAQNGCRFENGFGEIVVTRWSPRPEFDNPVNRILVAFREALTLTLTPPVSLAALWIETEKSRTWDAWGTSAEIEHARRVLTRLAGWSA